MSFLSFHTSMEHFSEHMSVSLKVTVSKTFYYTQYILV
jgi:hypothetical protein